MVPRISAKARVACTTRPRRSHLREHKSHARFHAVLHACMHASYMQSRRVWLCATAFMLCMGVGVQAPSTTVMPPPLAPVTPVITEISRFKQGTPCRFERAHMQIPQLASLSAPSANPITNRLTERTLTRTCSGWRGRAGVLCQVSSWSARAAGESPHLQIRNSNKAGFEFSEGHHVNV